MFIARTNYAIEFVQGKEKNVLVQENLHPSTCMGGSV